jgi:hypothetical protein
MTRDDIHRTLLAALAEAAPEAGVHLLDPARPLQQQVPLDAAHWLSFFEAVQDRLGVDLPGADFGLLCTLEQLEHHCEEKLARRS